MAHTIFIDGEVGTTGLQIRERLIDRDDVEIVSLPDDKRKNPAARAEFLNGADLSILCLPDDAARQAVSLIDNPAARVIDASSAHRVAYGWVYGMPEYDAGQGARIAEAKRVSNPGCYAISAVAMLHPLIVAGLLPADYPVTINAISGYSGGGRKLIKNFEHPDLDGYTEDRFRVYGLGLAHKHVPEIQGHSGLTRRPLFVPSIGRFSQGMIVQLPLQLWSLPGEPVPADIHAALTAHYDDCAFVSVADSADAAEITGLQPELLNGTNELRLHVFGNTAEGQAVIIALIDNLGKGASGQAVQNINLMLGLPEAAGLR